MNIGTIILVIYSVTIVNASFFSLSNIANYAKYIYPVNLTTSANGNELWTGILKDCSQKLSFSCVQKNAYSYLDDSLVEHDNITIFSGLILRKNKLNYETCTKNCKESDDLKDNLIETSKDEERSSQNNPDDYFYEEKKSPLEEITEALRDKTVKFLATRDYELELPKFFFDSSRIKISPREIDENGALVRIDFGERGIEDQGRLLFKKIRKFIQNRLIMSFLALLLIVKLIKVKFAFIIPFLFGAAVSKKIFLKILLFLVPAFAHVFKLCSAYYSSHSKSHHHHHHQIAHHHHHVPVPVPVPTYIDHHHHSPPLPPPPHHEEEFEGYDYANPHLQIRKDMEELKEWGIDTFAESYDDPSPRPHPQSGPIPGPHPQVGPIGGLSNLPQPGPIPGHLPQPGPISHHLPQAGPHGASFSQPGPIGQPQNFPTPNFDIPQFSGLQRPNLPFMDKFPSNIQSPAQSLAYNGYLEDQKLSRRSSIQVNQQSQAKQSTPLSAVGSSTIIKSNSQAVNPVFTQQAATVQTRQVIPKPSVSSSVEQTSNQVLYDDTFYGPILTRLDDIFMELRFAEEACRERLVCSMYKNPERYSPHSNHVSNELSRNPQELKHGGNISQENKRFNQYVDAARVGQDGGDCLRSYPCHINTE